MLTTGPNGKYTPGVVLLVDRARAAVLVSRGHAEFLRKEELPGPDELRQHTNRELRAMAEDFGLDLPSRAVKAELVQAIIDARRGE